MVPTGAYMRVTVDCGFPLVALMTRRSIEEMELRAGAPVTAHFKSTAPHLMRHG
jgi:molybdopterin-binding protein